MKDILTKFKTTKKVVILSFVINVIFLLIFSFLVYYKRNSIKNRIEKIVYNQKMIKNTNEKTLALFNKEPYVSSNGSLDGGFDRAISILFLGNSLTFHRGYDEDDGKPPRGMAASDVENDYVHLLMKKIADEKKMNIDYSIINIADFERHFSEFSFDKSRLEKASVKNPDFLIVQIGENISYTDITKNGDKFEQCYVDLLNCFPNSIKIITLPFWPSKEKINHITSVAIRSNSFLVDISHLGSGIDVQNFAYYTRNYKQPGVGTHPGDYGMKNIADCIWTVFANVIN